MNLYPEELQDEISQAFANGFVDEGVIDKSALKRALAANRENQLAQLQKNRHYTLITNTIAEMEWWAAFRPSPVKQKRKPVTPRQVSSPASATKKVGRNSPCHCGSGKKYKKCCWPN